MVFIQTRSTRLISNIIKVKDWSDQEELIELVEKIFSKNAVEIEKITKTVAKYDFVNKVAL